MISDQQLALIGDLCRRYRVAKLELFGSAARSQGEVRDYDFIAHFENPDEPGICSRFLDFAEALEQSLGKPVDLLTPRMLRNPYFIEAVNASRIVVYDKEPSAEIAP